MIYNMPKNNVTFVTSYFTIYEKEDISPLRTFEKRLEFFFEIANRGVNICIFISPDHKEKFLEITKKYENIKVIDIYDKNELKFSKRFFPELELCELPKNRNDKKDTNYYMNLMNSKIDFVKEAIEQNPFSNKYFCWFDFALPYIFKDFDKTIMLFNEISDYDYKKSFLIIPGCWNYLVNDIDYIKNNICWRFCGGFFIGDKDSLLNFYNVSINNYDEFLKITKTNVWEVNYWAWLESCKDLNPLWYLADHDDSIINIPEYLYN